MQSVVDGIQLRTDVKLKKPLQYRGDQTNSGNGPLSDDVFVWKNREGFEVTDNRKK